MAVSNLYFQKNMNQHTTPRPSEEDFTRSAADARPGSKNDSVLIEYI